MRHHARSTPHRAGALCAVFVVILAFTVAEAHAAAPFPGRPDPSALVGTPAPPLALDTWLTGASHEIAELRGRVILVRWFTDTCPFCARSAPVLRDLSARYAPEELTVLGIFHPKPPGALDRERAVRVRERFGFEFSIAVDADWSALRRWWLSRVEGGWTSVTFVIDKRGIIRYVHPGGEFHPGSGGAHWNDHASCNAEYEQIVTLLERLLAEPYEAAADALSASAP